MARRGAAFLAIATIVLATASVPSGGAADSADPGWVAQPTSATTNVSDGQRIVINLKSTSPDVSINALELRECRFGAKYAVAADTSPDNGNCPPRAVSSSADYLVDRGASDGLTALAKTAAGANVPFIVGQGVVDWTSSKNHELVCDPTHPCALVLELDIGTASGPSEVFQTIKLTFTNDDPLAACGGFARGALTTGGSDEISDAWAQWTRSECVHTHKGAPTSVSFPGEGPAVTSFVDGQLDLVYTGSGYDASVGLAPAGAAGVRNAVAIPIALNASVIAAGGGEHAIVGGQPIGDKARYPDGSLEMTAADVGALLAGGQTWISRFDKPYSADILSRNPVLQQILYDPYNGVYAPSESLASTWFMTNYLATLAPADFATPAGAAHGAVPSLALSSPAFDQINLYTGRPALAKVTVPAEVTSNDGPIWTMTDLGSARALDLTPVALQSGSGFVSPTAASMDAAVAAMKPDADGLLVPDPSLATTTVAAGAVQPYPLTYVVYALAPAEPLVDPSSCQLRPASQALLASWLRYLVGSGQQQLPGGMQKLPPALLTQAQAAIAKVGASAITGACKGKQHHGGGGTGTGTGKHGHGKGTGNGTPTTTAPAPAPAFTGSGPTANFDSNLGGSSAIAAGAVQGTNSIGRHVVRAAEAAVKIPAFAGTRLTGPVGAIIALIGIALLMSFAAWLTAGSAFGGFVKRRRPAGAPTLKSAGAPTLRSIGAVAVVWIGAAAIGTALVVFALGPMLQQRDQRALLARYRVTLSDAANELQGLPGAAQAPQAPSIGAPVGVLEIGALKVQDVVVEGVDPAQTSVGPGHVPGTAGLGQPGNSVLVARHKGYGAAFERLGRLREGDQIVVTTTQGQSVYDVTVVRHVRIAASTDAPGSAVETPVHLTSASVRPLKTTLDRLYGPSSDDRLTLVTASGGAPWETSSATEVVARLEGEPFAPTPQQARSADQTGTKGQAGSLPAVVLALLAFGAVVAGSVVLYRRLRFRTAYILSIAPLVAITVVAGETLARLLPAWT